MSLVRSKQSLDLIQTAYEGGEEAELVLTSYQLRKPQKDMIKGLAKQSAMHQAAVLRAIIDEWCQMKLSD